MERLHGRLLAFGLFWLLFTNAAAEPLRLGVLAPEGAEQARQRWQPTARYLAETTRFDFQLAPLNGQDLQRQVRMGRLDFVLSDPATSERLVRHHGARPLAIPHRQADRDATGYTALILFTRAPEPLAAGVSESGARRLAVSGGRSIGLYRAAWESLAKGGLPVGEVDSPTPLVFASEAGVVEAVLDGRAGAGVVPAPALKRLAREGRLDPADLRILHTETVTLRKGSISPEPWALARLPHVPGNVAARVALALVRLSPGDRANQAADLLSWSVPAGADEVHELLASIDPVFRHPRSNTPLLTHILQDHWPVFLLVLTSIVFLTGMTARATVLNRRLQRSQSALEHARARLETRVDERTRALEQEKNLSQTMFDALPGPVFVFDEEGRAVFWNRYVEETLGYDAGAIASMGLPDFFVDADRTPVEHAINRVLRTGQAYTEGSLRINGGTTGTFGLAIRRVEHGERTLVVGVGVDITGRRRMEERLKQAACVFENSQEGIVVTDPHERILAVNKAFTRITGFQEEEVLGGTPRLVNSGRQGPEFYREMWSALETEGIWQGEIWNRRRNGTVYPEWLTISAIRDEHGRVSNYVGVFSDLSESKRAQEKLDYLTHYDGLTGLPNRFLFRERLSQALQRAKRHGGRLTTYCLDLDGFKHINNSRGHPIGDQLVRAVGQRLRGLLRQDDTLARAGGDDFLILADTKGDKGAVRLVEKLLAAFEHPFLAEGEEIPITASIGISLFPEDGEDDSQLIKNADAAMYRAKEQGRSRYAFYTAELTRAATERVYLEGALREAIERGDLEVHYQPQIDLRTGRLIGAEALVRWDRGEDGAISPARFIPLAEENGLIHPLTVHVLEQVCQQVVRWQEAGFSPGRVAVNLSPVHLREHPVVEIVRRALDRSGMDPELLELEVTEAVFVQDTRKTLQVFDELRALGVRLAVDDFGTGYSSLSYLKLLPIQRLKIDRSFVQGIPGDGNDEAIVRAIIGLSENLELEVVAEGVETAEQAEFLRQAGCQLGQGFLYGPAQRPEDLPGLAARLHSTPAGQPGLPGEGP